MTAPAGPTDGVVLVPGGEARADHEVGRPRGHGVEQLGDLRRIVLAVGVALHDDRVAVRDRVPESAAQRAADTEVDRQAQHLGAGALRDLGGAVDRTVVDDERRVTRGVHLVDDAPDRRFLVERGDHHEHAPVTGGAQPHGLLGHRPVAIHDPDPP